MISLPWQLPAAMLALLGLAMCLQHFKRESCTERIELAKREAARNATNAYRESYRTGILEARQDAKFIGKDAKK